MAGDRTKLIELPSPPMDGIEEVRSVIAGLEDRIADAAAVVVGIRMRDGTYQLAYAGSHDGATAAAAYMTAWLTEG